jgi:hypothetical protein
MTDNKKVGPQGTIPGETDTNQHQTTSQYNGGGRQGESRESSFFVTGDVDRSDELLEWYAEDDPVGGEL